MAPNIATDILTHNSTSDFSFPSEAKFFRQKLQPLLAKLRGNVLEHYANLGEEHREEWSKHFHIHLSLNSGTTPILISILNALKDVSSSLYFVEEAKKWPQMTPFQAEVINKNQFIQIPAIEASEIKDEAQKRAIEEMIL